MLPPLRDLLNHYGISADKRLGQHFLFDGNITDKIVRLCGDLSPLHVVEVGPGPGGLTRSILAAQPLSYTGIERDERCLPLLQNLCAASSVSWNIQGADALKVSLPQITPAPRAVIANLPYNVGTELLIHWLHDIACTVTEQGEARNGGGAGVRPPPIYNFLTLMFQKEVVDRLAAVPGTKDYGRLSILTQWLCEVQPLFDLPPSAFTPPPKVTSTVVKLVPRLSPEPCSVKALEKVTAAAFGQRRKMLRSSLKPLGGEDLLQEAGIEPTLRAENLTVAEFVRLANLL